MKQHRNYIKYIVFYVISLSFLLNCVAVKYKDGSSVFYIMSYGGCRCMLIYCSRLT